MQTTITPEWKGEVRKRMTILGMTYEKLAEDTGYSDSTIRKYMCGLYTSDKPRERIERVLGMR